jgi:23S rRNA (uracil1939-C5)-methyltransferase
MGEQETRIIDTPTCPVLIPKLNEALPLIVRDVLRLVPHPVEVWLGQGREGVALSISCDNPLPPAVYEAARNSTQGPVCTIVACIAGHWSAMAGNGNLRIAAADGRDMTLPAGGFGQANEEVNLLLGERIGDLLQSLGAKRGLELFSGAGNLTPVLAQHIGGLECVELDPRAVAAARSNLTERELTHIGVHQADAFDGLRKFGKDRDIVILDPPRTGCIEVAQTLAATKPKWVLYVSCDPATLARDLGPLRQSGYSIVHAAGFDMFPQTPHLEAVVLLER